MIASEPVEALKEKVKETVEKILPPIKKNIINNKNEIWDEISRLINMKPMIGNRLSEK